MDNVLGMKAHVRTLVKIGNLLDRDESVHLSRDNSSFFCIEKEYLWHDFGLEKHIIFANILRDYNRCVNVIMRVGIIEALLGFDIIIGKYIFPSMNPDIGPLKYILSKNKVGWVLDFQIDSITQIFNPASLVLMGDKMDWDSWQIRLTYLLKHPELNENVERWISKRGILTRSPKFQDVKEKKFKYFISFQDDFIRSNARLILVFHKLNPSQSILVEIMINSFPIVLSHDGSGRFYSAQNETKIFRSKVVEIIIPTTNIPLLMKTLGDLFAYNFDLHTDQFLIIPFLDPISIPLPKNYPENPLNLYRTRKNGGRVRSSSMVRGRISTLEEQWKNQLKINND
ncbi:MAG: hypothetical protein ACTSUE_20900 [Promethearchaeota archaeon]